ncbi:PRMT5-domain-containing protein [Paramicrosporidium saccamoebae]|uniref:PRMT5-domain-containing protein n=1 Tax=Paramicrosporidium saccamoebae TaxID=1246581 RepID=A0A2H9TL85_9FUNG|nr:PRMT5-domain-containing protein [Paramicrosporidium saccamoebae]
MLQQLEESSLACALRRRQQHRLVVSLAIAITSVVNGGLAGVAARTVSSPIDLLKIRFQLQAGNQYSSILGAVRSVIREEGPLGFWKGNMAGLWLYASYSAVQFSIYEKIKGKLGHTIDVIIREEGPRGLYKGMGPSLAQVVPYMGIVFAAYERSKRTLLAAQVTENTANVLSGMISGFVSKLIMMPVDVIRKRLQIQGSQYRVYILKDLPIYNGFFDCIKSIWRVEGPRGFFSGLSLALLKSVPATTTTFLVVLDVDEIRSVKNLHREPQDGAEGAADLHPSYSWLPNLIPGPTDSPVSFIVVDLFAGEVNFDQFESFEQLWSQHALVTSELGVSPAASQVRNFLEYLGLTSIIIWGVSRIPIEQAVSWINETFLTVYLDVDIPLWRQIYHQVPRGRALAQFDQLVRLGNVNEWIANDLGMFSIKTDDFMVGANCTADDFMVGGNCTAISLPHNPRKVLERLLLQETPSVMKFTNSLVSECTKYCKKTIGAAGPKPYIDTVAGCLEDVFQTPLQPLADHLSAETYAVFEQDQVKYEQYREAIRNALDRLNSPTILIVGAGRGPLVDQVLDASEGLKVQIIAMEKNPSAYLTLKDRNKRDWMGKVRLVFGDIRQVAVFKVDVVVSELLGSFGDNELAPECIIAALKFLKEGGIMIPETSHSYIQPVTYLKSHRIIAQHPLGSEIAVNSPHVVYTRSAMSLADPQLVFSFNYKATEVPPAISTRITFTIQSAGYLDGFLGYFTSNLFGKVSLSTCPDGHTPHMASWFPIFFPYSNRDRRLSQGDVLTIEFLRISDEFGVWYQWKINDESWYNQDGKYYKIKLQ